MAPCLPCRSRKRPEHSETQLQQRRDEPQGRSRPAHSRHSAAAARCTRALDAAWRQPIDLAQRAHRSTPRRTPRRTGRRCARPSASRSCPAPPRPRGGCRRCGSCRPESARSALRRSGSRAAGPAVAARESRPSVKTTIRLPEALRKSNVLNSCVAWSMPSMIVVPQSLNRPHSRGSLTSRMLSRMFS